AFGVGAFLRNATQGAVGAEHPAVIEALKHAGLAGPLPADAAAAMRAEIVEHVDLALGVAIEDEIAAGHGASDERSGLCQLAVMAAVEPAALEDLFVLEVEHVLVGEDAPRDLEGSRRLVHPHFKGCSDVLIHGSSSR